MVISSKLNEKKPPGGSSFSGHYDRKAFAASIYPKGDKSGKGAFKDRLQQREHHEMTAFPDAMHAASVEYTAFREPGKPSRLRAAYDEAATRATKGKTLGERRFSASASSPAVGMSTQEGWEVHAGSVRVGPSGTLASLSDPGTQRSTRSAVSAANLAAAQACYDPQTAASFMMNTRWYPHICASRGSLKLSQPRALLQGVDPLKDTGHKCSFWEAEEHRFSSISNLPDAKPRTPTRSLRWRSSEAWDNPQNHFTMKVTQTLR
mmetsp:Transcript_112228/g.312339  ORF Transcript_112228/g.312339 Transcript_112228/m.312339 type:complete len:263 (-) Transcript_112228:213-1001(-)